MAFPAKPQIHSKQAAETAEKVGDDAFSHRANEEKKGGADIPVCPMRIRFIHRLHRLTQIFCRPGALTRRTVSTADSLPQKPLRHREFPNIGKRPTDRCGSDFYPQITQMFADRCKECFHHGWQSRPTVRCRYPSKSWKRCGLFFSPRRKEDAKREAAVFSSFAPSRLRGQSNSTYSATGSALRQAQKGERVVNTVAKRIIGRAKRPNPRSFL